MASLKWNRIAIIHENNLYGESGARKLKETGVSKGLCVVETYSIDIQNGVNTNQLNNAMDEVITTSTNGIVFFGGVSSASTFFNIIQSRDIHEVPIVMVSEGIDMDTAAFRRSDSQFINAARGNLAVTPLYRQVEEFKVYWKSIFTLSDVYNDKSITNQWLKDVFKSISPACVSTECAFIPIDQTTLDAYFSSSPLFLQYAIVAAHGLANAVQTLHTQQCGPYQGICPKFIEHVQSGDILTGFNGLTVDFATDFTWR